jgi:hypothetical protein
MMAFFVFLNIYNQTTQLMSDLNITIQESIILPNGNKEIASNSKTIPGINQVLRRIDTISTTFSGSGIEILKFVNSESEQTAGSFVKDEVKYVRITNLDATHNVEIYLIDTNQESVVFKLDAGKSLMFGNVDFNATQVSDYVVEGIWDPDYYSSFVNYDTVKAKAISSSIKLEYFVAST